MTRARRTPLTSRRFLRFDQSLYGKAKVFTLPDDPDERVDATLEAMRAVIHDTDRTQLVHRLATRIAAAAPWKKRAVLVRAVWDLLRPIHKGGVMQFNKDTRGRELLRHPDQLVHEILEDGTTAGDCDDRAMLGASLLRAMGFRTALAVVSPEDSDQFAHVLFGIDKGQGRFFPLDPQETSKPGNLPKHRRLKIIWVDA